MLVELTILKNPDELFAIWQPFDSVNQIKHVIVHLIASGDRPPNAKGCASITFTYLLGTQGLRLFFVLVVVNIHHLLDGQLSRIALILVVSLLVFCRLGKLALNFI